MTPRPCRGGAGVGSVSFIHTQLFPYFSIFFLKIADPTPIPPLQGRGNITYGFVLNTTSFVGPNSISFP